MKKLDLGFRSATKNTTHHLQLKYVKDELDVDVIKEAMNQIAELGIFSNKNGEAIYAKPVSASYVDTTEEVLFSEDMNENA